MLTRLYRFLLSRPKPQKQPRMWRPMTSPCRRQPERRRLDTSGGALSG